MYEDAPGTAVSRLLQVPQYVVLTAAEVMFSVTGLGFAYSQVDIKLKNVNFTCNLVAYIYTGVTGDDRKQDKSAAKTLENVLISVGRRLSVVPTQN